MLQIQLLVHFPVSKKLAEVIQCKAEQNARDYLNSMKLARVGVDT